MEIQRKLVKGLKRVRRSRGNENKKEGGKKNKKEKRFTRICSGPAAAVTRLEPFPTAPQLSPMRNNEL